MPCFAIIDTIFAVINALMVPVVYFLYPETAHRSLEDIDKIFEASDPKKPWDVVRVAHEMPITDHSKGDVDPEAVYALKIRERKGYTDAEKEASQHYEHGAPKTRDFDAMHD